MACSVSGATVTAALVALSLGLGMVLVLASAAPASDSPSPDNPAGLSGLAGGLGGASRVSGRGAGRRAGRAEVRVRRYPHTILFARPPDGLARSRLSQVDAADLAAAMDDDDALFEMNKRQMSDDYGHMRFGKRAEGEFDDYGHMRFGRSSDSAE